MSERPPERPSLERLLRWARTHKMTPEEIRAQRISWVYGQLQDCAPHITKEQIAEEIDRNGRR
jgi:hypothetical protein